jgi:LysR family transcriptional regulator, cys regulon transcriptional activator
MASTAIVPKGHELEGRQVTLESLADYPILTYTRGITGRSNIEKAFNSAGILLDITLAAADSDVIKTYVRLGYGVGIIAGIAFEPKFDSDLVAISLKDLIPVSITKFAYLKQGYLPKYTHYYIEQLLSSTPKID